MRIDLKKIQRALQLKGMLTKTQLRVTQETYAISNQTLADLFGLKLSSFNALKSNSVGSGNYSTSNKNEITKFIADFDEQYCDFEKDLRLYGMCIIYTEESWPSRIGQALKFNDIGRYHARLHQFFRDNDRLLKDDKPLVISTKELSHMLYTPEHEVTKAIEKPLPPADTIDDRAFS